jgi:AraC-like DNA-binding protein
LKQTTSTTEQKELRASNKQELEAICAWINANINEHIGWDELSRHSKRSHTDLIDLFRQINTTPMAYIRCVKETAKVKEDIKEKTTKIIKDIQLTGPDVPLKRSKLITHTRISEADKPPAQPQAHSKSSKSSESIDTEGAAHHIYQTRKHEITHKIQSIDREIKVTIDSDMDMKESNSHIITLRKKQDVRTVGLNKEEFFNVGDQFNISALLRIMTAMSEMR